MSTITTARHQVAIAGQVVDGLTAAAISGVNVAIVSMPASFERRLQMSRLRFGREWLVMTERLDRTRSRADGTFYFLDLPEGDYCLSCSATGYGSRYGAADRQVKVSRDAQGSFKLGAALVRLPATAVRGGVTNKKVNLGYAKVRVQGSGESTYTDDAGQYLIAGIEAGQRTLLVSAQGYRSALQVVSIASAGMVATLNISLLRDSG